MNAFYERLEKFGALINYASEHKGEQLDQLFTVIHPGHPIVSHTRSTTPALKFEQSCPITIRRKIRQILRKAFSARSST